MSFRFVDPWFLALLALLPLAHLARRRERSSVTFSSIDLFDLDVPTSWRQRLHRLPDALQLLWIGLCIVALARPQTPDWSSVKVGPTQALMFALDVSGSMAAIESAAGGTPRTRLDEMKAAAKDWLNDDRPSSEQQTAVGAVSFSSRPEIVCPLTRYHTVVAERIDGLTVDLLENRTNIGDALAVALDKLRQADASERRIVLISDGAHNIPEALGIGEAARVALALGIPIDVVAVGAASANAETAGPDEPALERIAQVSGGRYARVENVAELAAWRNAERPVRANSDTLTVRRYREHFREFLWAAIGVWLVEVLLRKTLLRITPEESY